MPKEYLDDRLTMLSDHAYQVNKAQTDTLTKDYIDDARKIQDRVQILVSAFDPSKCPTQ
jgi:RNase P subunit RPR2